MNIFWNTLQFTLGVIAPFAIVFIIIALVYLAIGVIAYRKTIVEHKTEMLKKQPPFDDEAEFSRVPNPDMIGVTLKKDGKIVWDGAVYKDKDIFRGIW